MTSNPNECRSHALECTNLAETALKILERGFFTSQKCSREVSLLRQCVAKAGFSN
jgi:hypothetical protein